MRTLIACSHGSSEFSSMTNWTIVQCVQPSAARAFQRVKVEEVELLDDRLADNSYWAKVRILAYFR